MDGQSREFPRIRRDAVCDFRVGPDLHLSGAVGPVREFHLTLRDHADRTAGDDRALLALFLTGGTLNVYSQIGLVMLVGLITKNGIPIVEFANQLRLTGLDRQAAVLEAATLRLRPILMTTLATVLGAIPWRWRWARGRKAVNKSVG